MHTPGPSLTYAYKRKTKKRQQQQQQQEEIIPPAGCSSSAEEQEAEAAATAPPGAEAAEVARVRRELLAACVTCPLCGNLLRDATTITECLHSFCRKCIFDKLTDEELDCCPKCNIDLGSLPEEKLRPDHNLQDVRSKIFPLKRRKVDAPEVPYITLPTRRKERSLSSLVIKTPRVATQTCFTGRRTKTTARRRASALRRLGPIIGESTKKVVNQVEICAENSSSSETLGNTTQNRRQNSSTAQPSKHAPDNSTENGNGPFKEKPDLWESLNCLVDVVNGTKKANPSSHYSTTNCPDSEVLLHNKTKARVQTHTSKLQDEKVGCIPQSPVTVKAKKMYQRKKMDITLSNQVLIDAAEATRDRRNCPIWLSLLPTMEQNKDATVPQTHSCYLRIKDGNLPISFIQKYLVKKLNLPSEAEVEIACRSQIVSSTSTLNNLADLWLQSESKQRVQATLGASAKDFVMVLSYRCKTPET